MKTNEQAKQEAIKKAWINEFPNSPTIIEDIKDFLDIDTGHVHKFNLYDRYRPASLNGIENNNGWIRIEPDGSNLPESGEYRWLFESGSMSNFYYEPGDIMSTKLTHYKPITPELKPIY